ncbi:MAG: ArnT family glycosyltransferase [Planctomycetaceae bacterium]
MSDAASTLPPSYLPIEGDSRWPRNWEWLALTIIVLVGFALRAFDADHISVEHYDEGVYASNWFYQPPGEADPLYPKQYLYAPPLLPNLCFWWLFFSGSNPHSVVWINIFAGTLTIPLFWWVGRSWFGVASGLLAAALCAFSDLHIALSRMVLTDVLLLLFLTAGVWTGVRAIQTGRPLWNVLGGVFAGLAWWTKYNGWLTLAITGAGLAGWLVFDRPKSQPITPLLFRWLAMAVIAVVVWSPVVIGLQDVGGYAVVSANHSRYIVGIAGWWDGVVAQCQKLGYLESWLCIGIGLLAIGIAYLAERSPRGRGENTVADVDETRRDRLRSWMEVTWKASMVAAAVGAAILKPRSVVMFGGLLSGLMFVRSFWRQHQRDLAGEVSSSGRLPRWVVLAWFVSLLLATPLYTPYPRLTPPLVAVMWLLMALLSTSASQSQPAKLLSWSVLLLGTLLSLSVAAGFLMTAAQRHQLPETLPRVAWQDRRGLEVIAAPLADAAERDFAARPTVGHQQMKAALYVFAEPGLFYHLAALPKRPDFRFFVQPLGDHALLSGANPHPELATYLVAGPHADAVASDVDAIAQAEQEGLLELVASFPYHPSDLVLLDETAPHAWTETLRNQSIRLYRRR